VAQLGLDDIDWSAATITLRHTKGRRDDVMPLPAATGQAIADYLKFERPQTTNRAVFVRNVAPRDKPVGPNLIQQSIRQAYARAGLPYTRSHLLRHTMASRLLAGGSSIKEVADVLRHRSLNTTLVYAKLDSKNLAAVALPWPGSVS
jgi:integrase